MKRIILVTLIALSAACAQRKIAAEPTLTPPPVSSPQPKPQIRYVYLKAPEDTTSAMTMPALEPSQAEPRNLAQDVLHIFWPLLTLLAAGAVLIAGLFIEYKVIDKQLAKRRELKQSAPSYNTPNYNA